MENIRLEKKVEGIAEVRDESGRDGLRIVVELKKGCGCQGILAYLLEKDGSAGRYNFNMVAIVNKAPRQLGLKAMLEAYIAHQKEVVTFRTQYDLEKAEDRAHVLEGLVKALNILDEVIATIKASKNRQDAQKNLVDRIRLHRAPSGCDSDLAIVPFDESGDYVSCEKELEEMNKKIAHLRAILESAVELGK